MRALFAVLSPPQMLAIPVIAAGRHTLVCAPTGTGKTLCAFMSIISDLFARQAAGTLPDRIDTIYISPLKALGSDITKNLIQPLEAITALSAIENQEQIENPIQEGVLEQRDDF